MDRSYCWTRSPHPPDAPCPQRLGLTLLRGGLQDECVGLLNEVQLLGHMAGGEWVVPRDHDHLGDRGGAQQGRPWPGDPLSRFLLRNAAEGGPARPQLQSA